MKLRRPPTALRSKKFVPCTAPCAQIRCLIPTATQQSRPNQRSPFHWSFTSVSWHLYLTIAIDALFQPVYHPHFSSAFLFSVLFRTKASKVFYILFRDSKSCFPSSVVDMIFCWHNKDDGVAASLTQWTLGVKDLSMGRQLCLDNLRFFEADIDYTLG